MHTLLVVVGGFLLLALFLLLARDRARAALAFIPAWFAAAAVNLWVGVSRAGYTVLEELPVFLMVFAVPAAVAVLLWRRYASRARRAG